MIESKTQKRITISVRLMLLVSLALLTLGIISVQPVHAASPCYPGTACCVTSTQCGWCHSNWCPGGIGVLYNGNLKVCYDKNGNQTSVTGSCSWAPCGIGSCN